MNKLKKVMLIALGLVIVLFVIGVTAPSSSLNKERDPKTDALVTQGIKEVNKRNFNKAFELFNGACEERNVAGCYNLAGLYYDGKGTSKDIEKSKSLVKEVCDFGFEPACKSLEKNFK